MDGWWSHGEWRLSSGAGKRESSRLFWKVDSFADADKADTPITMVRTGACGRRAGADHEEVVVGGGARVGRLARPAPAPVYVQHVLDSILDSCRHNSIAATSDEIPLASLPRARIRCLLDRPCRVVAVGGHGPITLPTTISGNYRRNMAIEELPSRVFCTCASVVASTETPKRSCSYRKRMEHGVTFASGKCPFDRSRRLRRWRSSD